MTRKKRKPVGGGSGEWIVTYSDMMTLLLCFFVALFDSSDIDPVKYQQMVESFSNSTMTGFLNGLGSAGSAANEGRLKSGKSANAYLTSPEKGKKYSGPALKKAISEFEPEIKSNKVRVMATEEGIVVSLLSNAFFAPTSADLKIDDNREFLIRLADFLVAEDKVDGVHFKIEGHTDNVRADPDGPWKSNWALSSARAVNTLAYLILLGVNDRRFEVVGLSDTVPIASNESPEGRAYNRRVDVVISFLR